jgi:hypothetical protein
MTDPTPNGTQPTQQTESAISAGMAAGDTEAVMRAVATADVVVPQGGVVINGETPPATKV